MRLLLMIMLISFFGSNPVWAKTLSEKKSNLKVASKSSKATQNEVLTYKEWKKVKIQTAGNRFATASERLTIAKKERTKLIHSVQFNRSLNQKLERRILALEKIVSIERFSMENTKELKMADYIAGYILRSPNPQKTIKDAAERMSKGEVTELLSSYTQSMRHRDGMSVYNANHDESLE